jgi:hypothetical protein
VERLVQLAQRVYLAQLAQRELLELTDQQEQRALLEAMAQLVLQGLERKEAQVLQEQEQHQLIFKFSQLRAHLLGLNLLTQKLLKLLLLVEVVVAGLDK